MYNDFEFEIDDLSCSVSILRRGYLFSSKYFSRIFPFMALAMTTLEMMTYFTPLSSASSAGF
jgi:hypothetical protein